MSFLFGSSPSVKNTTASTVNPTQLSAQQMLLNSFLSGQGFGGGPFPGQPTPGQNFSAPLSSLQTSSLAGLQSLADNAAVTGQQTQTGTNTLTALNNAFGYQAPQVSAPTAQGAGGTVTPTNVTANDINATNAFQQGVVNPLTQNFTNQVIPTISGNAGKSAGGAYSSDTQLAEATAAQTLNNTLAATGSQYQLAADTANQQANLQASLANQNAGLTAQQSNQSAANQVALANLSSQEQTNSLNTGASLQGQSDILNAIGTAPNAITTPNQPQNQIANLLMNTLAGGAVPQQQQQTQLQGQNQDYLNQQNQMLSLLQLLAGFGVSPTQQTNTVVQPGQTGLLQSVLGGLATGYGKTL